MKSLTRSYDRLLAGHTADRRQQYTSPLLLINCVVSAGVIAIVSRCVRVRQVGRERSASCRSLNPVVRLLVISATAKSVSVVGIRAGMDHAADNDRSHRRGRMVTPLPACGIIVIPVAGDGGEIDIEFTIAVPKSWCQKLAIGRVEVGRRPYPCQSNSHRRDRFFVPTKMTRPCELKSAARIDRIPIRVSTARKPDRCVPLQLDRGDHLGWHHLAVFTARLDANFTAGLAAALMLPLTPGTNGISCGSTANRRQIDIRSAFGIGAAAAVHPDRCSFA